MTGAHGKLGAVNQIEIAQSWWLGGCLPAALRAAELEYEVLDPSWDLVMHVSSPLGLFFSKVCVDKRYPQRRRGGTLSSLAPRAVREEVSCWFVFAHPFQHAGTPYCRTVRPKLDSVPALNQMERELASWESPRIRCPPRPRTSKVSRSSRPAEAPAGEQGQAMPLAGRSCHLHPTCIIPFVLQASIAQSG